MVPATLFARRTVVNPVLFGLVVLLSTLTSSVQAQSNVGLAGKESPSVTDGVDVFSGQLENVLPLVTFQGRGEAQAGLYLPLRNSQWIVKELSSFSSPGSDRTYYFYKPELNGPGYAYAAGYNYSRGGYAMLGKLVVETKFTGWYFMETPSVTEITLTSNNGSIVHFRDVLTNGQPLDARGRGCVMSGFQPPNPPPACSRGRVFRSINGENMTFVADADIYDMIFYDAFGSPSPWSAQSDIAGTLYLSNGTRIRVQNSFNNITKITDRNGNSINIDYGVGIGSGTYNYVNKITDSLNREISIIYGDHTSGTSYFDEIVYKGFGNSERRIRINYSPIGNALIPGESLAVPVFPGVTTRCYLFTQEPCDPTPAGSSGPHYTPSTTVVPTSIVLPNGKEYQFYYNRYLELARVKSPAGSYSDYGYTGTLGAEADGFSAPVYFGGGSIFRRVASVRNFDDTDQLVNEKTFSNVPQEVSQSHPSFPVLDNLTVDVKDANGTVLSKTRHYFYETAMWPFASSYASFGRQYKTETLDPVSENVLRRTETTWQQREARGAIVNYYSNNFVQGGSGTDNDGNLLRQEIYIPGSSFFQDSFEYDWLNRLTSMTEKLNGSGNPNFKQTYLYDRWGNRRIDTDPAKTFGGVNNPAFDVENGVNGANRLYAPGDLSLPMNQRQMRYDAAGNLKHDSYTGQGIRVYDAENRMVEAAGNGQLQYYSYDGDGRRVKRKVNQVETCQVYGIGGELIAEYRSNGTQLSKEYGYRNGELLITATVSTGWGVPPSFSDNPLNPPNSPPTQMKLVHLTELREAVNSLRSHAGLPAFNYTVDPNPQQNVTTVKADHIRQLRTALEGARGQLGLSTGGYTNPTLTENSSLIYAVDFQEIRAQVLSAWQSGGGIDIRWLVADQLGTPRMIFDQTGSLANVSRHDYLPFGEDVPSSFRNGIPGYSVGDGERQKFTSKERDDETGLDYFVARYYSSTQGRFTSPDPLLSSGRSIYPQSWNRYSYVMNHPLSLIDPDGMDWGVATWFDEERNQWITDYHYFVGEIGSWNGHNYSAVNFGSDTTRTLDLTDGRTVVISNDPDALGGAYMRDITARPQASQEPVLPPSWMDHVPVLARGRQFLFHYNTQNFEAATLDFIVLSAELGTFSVAGPAAVSRSFATKSGEAIFYSGRGTFQLATQAARSEGGKLITDTVGGTALKVLTKPLPEKLASPVWNWGSKHFAQGASGSVRTFIREPLRPNSTWAQVEYPILRANPFVRMTPR